MTALESLVNIGPKLAADLRTVGVPDAETLRAVGAPDAARRLADAGLRDCTHAQRALEGALAGVRWTAGETTAASGPSAAESAVRRPGPEGTAA
jgi:TfoX C-terminal domain